MNKNDDILNAILGAAILNTAAEKAKRAENKVSEVATQAAELREVYDAFLDVGFTEEQATTFIAAMLS